MNRDVIICGAVSAASAVALGAFGAHALRATLDAQHLGWWQTGVQYQMWHALALVAVGGSPLPRARTAAALFVAGSLLFAGSLYLMALTGLRWLGMVTPLGGAALIGGWLTLVWSALRVRGT